MAIPTRTFRCMLPEQSMKSTPLNCVLSLASEVTLTTIAVHCVDDMIGSTKRKRSKRADNLLAFHDLCETRINKSTYTASILSFVNAAVVVSCLWASHHDVSVV